MDDNLLRKVDFNSLKLLKILGEERNTKRTAERMFLTQPAVSKQLKRLRDEFGDALFTRKQYGLEPTDYGKELLAKLPFIFEQLEAFFAPSADFEPSQYSGEISVAINTALYQPVSRQFYSQIRPILPKATLKIVNWGDETEHGLMRGTVNMGINFFPLEISKQVVQKKLGYGEFKYICREDHPVLSTEMKFEDVGQYPLALMLHPDFAKSSKESLLESLIKGVGGNPRVALRSDQLEMCLDVVAKSDSILPCMDVFDVALPEGTRFAIANERDRLGTNLGVYMPAKTATTPMMKWLYREVEAMAKQATNLVWS